MTFTIDTGTEAHPADLFIPDWFWDQFPANPDKNRLMHDYAYHLIGALGNPAKMDTVRRHALANWQFWQALAAIYPTVFDEFCCAYAERVLGS